MSLDKPWLSYESEQKRTDPLIMAVKIAKEATQLCMDCQSLDDAGKLKALDAFMAKVAKL